MVMNLNDDNFNDNNEQTMAGCVHPIDLFQATQPQAKEIVWEATCLPRQSAHIEGTLVNTVHASTDKGWEPSLLVVHSVQSFIGFPGSSEVGRRDLLALLHHQRALLLGFLHLGLLITIGLPQSTVQNLGGSIVHLLPAMEATPLAQRADRVGERMMHLRHPSTAE